MSRPTIVAILAIASWLPAAGTEDTIPPAPITVFRVQQLTPTSARLTWINVADDGTNPLSDRVTALWIGLSTIGPIDDTNGELCTRVDGPPLPAAPGDEQSVDVFNLAVGTRYWFVVWAGDERAGSDGLGLEGWSNASPSVGVLMRGDLIAPDTVDDLRSTAVSFSSVTLAWTAPGDDGTTGTATRYDLRRSLSPIRSDTEFAEATPVGDAPAPLPGPSPQTLSVTGLDLDTKYYFALKTLDEWDNESGLSALADGTTLDDLEPPAPVPGWSGHPLSHDSVMIDLVSPDDNDVVTRLDLRHSDLGPILTEADFARATSAASLPSPAEPGEPLALVVGGLRQSTTYHFAVKGADRKPNWSALTGDLSVRTLDGGSRGSPSCAFSATSRAAADAAILLLFLAGLIRRQRAELQRGQ